MPEIEKEDGIVTPNKILPSLWRGWVVAIGEGMPIKNKSFTFNPGVELGDFIYFDPSKAKFFSFNDISFSFVKMKDVDLIARK
jgi:co-chaperonin GroES (HSP10)